MIKLQIGGLFTLLFIMLVYFSTKREKTRNHVVFSRILVVSAVYMVFDMLTVYTVNHMDTVPYAVNFAAHKIFMCSAVLFAYLSANYVVQLIDRGLTVNRLTEALALLSVIVTPITYVEDERGNYSFGASAVLVYLVLYLYLILCGYYLIRYWRTINRKKRYPIILSLGTLFVIGIYGATHPYLYITSVGFVLVNLAFFLTVESPDVLLIEQLQKEKKRADDANEAKSSFLARMSHEIRTPIHVIAGMDEMILRESREETVRGYAADIQAATQSLLGLVNDILDLSKIESGKMTIIPTEYEVTKVVRELVNSVSEMAEKKKLELKLDICPELPTTLYGDGGRLRQIITNLLTNAVKYTHEGTVTFRMNGRQEGDILHLRVEVADTGIGIREEDREKLFEAFERIEEKRNRNIEGTGLGINITNELLHMMGSRLEVESTYGEGSVFSFELEQKIVDAEPVGNIEDYLRQRNKEYKYQASFTARQARLLVVDDNPMNRKVFRALLKETGVQIEEAESGKECLAKVREQFFHVIFMDHMMPDMDGVETFHCLREGEENLCSNTPVVILTANAVEGAKEKYLEEGFDGFLKKPIVPYKLERILQKLLPAELLEEGAEQRYRDNRDEAPLPDIEGVNYQYAGLFTKDENMILGAMRVFYESIDRTRQELQLFYSRIEEQEACSQFRIRVHSLKSNAALVGILSVSELARLLEYAAREGNLERLHKLMPVLLEELELYRQRLAPLFPMEKAEKPLLTDKGEFLAWLEMIRVSMLDMDMGTADMLAEKLQEYRYEADFAEEVERLLRCITEMDTEQAARIAEGLIEKLTGEKKGDEG